MERDNLEAAEKAPLIHEALQLYVEKTRRENSESRSWIRQPNNFISAVAIVLSLSSIGYEAVHNYFEGVDADLATLSSIASDLTQMDVQTLNATGNDSIQLAINNRRVVLLAEADRIIKERSRYIPTAQLAVLAPEYAAINEPSTSLKYSLLLTKDPATPFEQLESWSAIGQLYAGEGPNTYNDARSAFTNALQEVSGLPDPNGFGSIQLALSVREQWAGFENIAGNYPQAALQFNEAQKLLNRLPCVPALSRTAELIKNDGQAAIESLQGADATQGIQAEQIWSHTLASYKCAKATIPLQAAPATSQTSSSGMSTVCSFRSGQRSGTTFDFKQLGFPPHPIGTECRDGQGSVGVISQSQ